MKLSITTVAFASALQLRGSSNIWGVPINSPPTFSSGANDIWATAAALSSSNNDEKRLELLAKIKQLQKQLRDAKKQPLKMAKITTKISMLRVKLLVYSKLQSDAVEENCWDCSSPLITNKIFAVSGEGSSIATKVEQNSSYNNCLWSTRVMESGKHWMSLKMTEGEGNGLDHFFGLVRDGAAWDKEYYAKESTDAWYMGSDGSLWGNGKYRDDYAGEIKEGQIVSMEADLDKGTLRFWVDGKQHGPGFTSGVTGRVRWAVSVYRKGGAAEIVPTPELQPWSA